MKRSTALAALAGLCLAPAWMTSARAAARAPLRVVATFSILADMVRQVAGPLAEVHSLVPAGGDSHVYEPGPADVQKLAHADLVFVNGLNLEGWIDRLIRSSGYKGRVIVVSQGVQARMLDGHPDPHAWQSLRWGAQYVRNIQAALKSARPQDAAQLDRQAQAYLQQIQQLDQWVHAQMAAVAPTDRRAVTTHDAFGYFAAEYGMTWLSPQGWTTASDVSARDVARVVQQLRAQRVHALFLENAGDPRMMEQIAREAGVKVGGELYADSLSAPNGDADSYLKLVRHNVTTILSALRATGANR